MSEDLLCPYLSLATADTVIVAMYKKVIDIELTYNHAEMKVHADSEWLRWNEGEQRIPPAPLLT